MRWRNVIIVCLGSIPLIALFSYGFCLDPREVPSVLPGKPAPVCNLISLEGEPFSLAQLRGKPTLVNFWSTWCVPCEAEHNLLQVKAKSLAEQVEFVGVVYQDEEAAAKRYLERKGSTYVQAMDPGSKCSIEYGVAGVPETFFIDEAGIVRHKEAGPLTVGTIEQHLRPLLGAHP